MGQSINKQKIKEFEIVQKTFVTTDGVRYLILLMLHSIQIREADIIILTDNYFLQKMKSTVGTIFSSYKTTIILLLNGADIHGTL